MKKFSLILLFILLLSGCGTKKQEQENNRIEETNTATVTEDYSSLSDELFGFGYRKEEKGIVPSIGVYGDYIKDMHAVYTGDTTKKRVYLTFDEGYENGFTAGILDTLKEKKVPAIFFCTGDYLKRNKELIDRMINEGHLIGNHTWNHPSMPKLKDAEKIRKELSEFDDYLFSNHKTRTNYFRYPGGEFSKKTLAVIKDMGYKTLFWSLAYKDWERDVTRGCDYAVNQVVSQLHNGAVILLHAVSQDNADALPLIIDALRKEGYSFGSVDELNF